uniref:HTH CENPB-type domain-containing protein n=1 Tax=Pelodiscus sinensis TaxID=13735 RepID=K7F702_PELSI
LSKKLDIIRHLEKGVNRKVLTDEYSVGSSTLYDIKAQKDKLLTSVVQSETKKGLEKCHTLHKLKLEQLDKALNEWFALKRSEGHPISGPMLIEKAKDFYKQMELTEPCAFSEGWLQCFKLQHGIRRLHVSGEKASADHEAAESYYESFKKLVSEDELSADQIYHADESYWPTSTLADEGEFSASGFKQNNDRLTVLTCANASGYHRIKFVIGKYVKPTSLKGVIHLSVEYKAQYNAWMDCDIFSNIPSHLENLRKLNKPEDSKVILLLDNYRVHPSETDLVSGNIFTVFLPPNVTSLIQPMDNLQETLHATVDPVSRQHQGISISVHKDVIFSVACAWNTVKSQTLRRSWRKLWLNSIFAEGSSDEEENFEGFSVTRRKTEFTDIIEVLKQAEPKNPLKNLKEDEVEEQVYMDNNADVTYSPSDTEIREKVLNPEKSLPPEYDSEEDKTSWANASSDLSTLIKFAERHSSFSSQEVIQLYAQET